MSMYETQEWEMPGGELESQEWESEGYETQEWESEGYETQEWESADRESQEMELVNELLEVTSEQELEQFLGNLFRRAASAVGGAIRSPLGRALTDTLKNVARQALPVAAGALGNLVVPGLGGQVGSRVGSMASQMFEMELEAMNEQEAEFEVARRFVRLATTAARQAARASGSGPPRAVARAALITAARRHAPGLFRGTPASRRGTPQRRRQPGQVVFGGPVYGVPATGCPHCGGEPTYQDTATGAVDGDGDGDGDFVDGDANEMGWPANTQGRPQTGRWIRRGRKIVIMGA